MTDIDFRIVHVDHNNTTLGIFQPVDNTLRWAYRVNDIGDISYELNLQDTELIQANIAYGGENFFAPYKTDWRLGMSVYGGSWHSIHAGIHTNVGLRPRSGTVQISGKDWLHWLEQPVWFNKYAVQFDLGNLEQIFDADVADWTFTNGFYNSDYIYAWVATEGATFKSVIDFLLNNSKRGTDFVNLAPVYNGLGFGAGNAFTYVIQFQDETNILDHLKTLSTMSDPYGFDFYTDWDKKIYFFSPRKVVANSPTPIWTLTDENVVISTVPDFEWLNNGPLGTYIVGLGPGNPATWHIKKDQDSIDLYRQWTRLVRVGDTYVRYTSDLDLIIYATQGLQYIYPHKDLNLSIYPNKVNPVDPGDGFKNHIGDVVRFKWELYPYHTVNAYFWITQQEYHGDAAGNYICDLGLEQIYG